MKELIDDVRNRLLPPLDCGGRIALLFDYDGTLAPLVEHPRLARLSRETRKLLARLARRRCLGVGILSSRSLEDLREMVSLSGLCLAGCCGLELDLQGTHLCCPGAQEARRMVASLVNRLEQEVKPYAGAWVEDKHVAAAVHFRAVPADRVGELRHSVERAARPWADQLHSVAGPMVIEITPDLGWTKGTAVQLIVQHLGFHTRVLYAGDSANDAEAFETVNAMNGISIGIGEDAPPTATHRLSHPAALLAFLQRLDELLPKSLGRGESVSINVLALYGLWKSTIPGNPM